MRARAALAVAAVALPAALAGAASSAPAGASARTVASAAATPRELISDFTTAPAPRRAGNVAITKIRTPDGRAIELSGSGRLVQSLVHDPGALSIDVRVPDGARLALNFGSDRLVLTGGRGGVLAAAAGGWRATVRRRTGWGRGGWRHLELAATQKRALAIDGRRLAAPLGLRGPLVLRAPAGRPAVTALLVTRRGDAAGLLHQRLANLHARTRLGTYPFGSDARDATLRFSPGWTSGFWPGALWRAYESTHSRILKGWALAATVRHLGDEREPIHDQGFRYVESSARAYDDVCPRAGATTCGRLKTSALRAAGTLLALQRGNAAAGTIPTLPASKRCRMCRSKAEAETIIDSMMNVSLVEWAYARTGRDSYRDAALRHVRGVARMLVRSDGSSAQAVRTRRSDGRVIGTETHQGISADSTWSRGEAWAVYGFATAGSNLKDAESIGVSERAAAYVESHLPAGGIPPYDYAAPRGAPVDTSAGVITAAGLERLAHACETIAGACGAVDAPAHWRGLAARMLAASLRHLGAQPPLGYLADQVFTLGGHARWDDRGDFIFGTAYALDALADSNGSAL